LPAVSRRDEVLQQLADGVSRLTTTDEWQRYLDCQSRFHSYSFGNAILIAAQRRDATKVAGFHTWQKLNRVVKKSEKALWILAPMVSKGSEPVQSSDTQTDDRHVWGFKPVPVFDISQTDGPELPTVCHQLEGDDPTGRYGDLLNVAASIGFTVNDHQFAGGTNGDCNHRSKRIRVESRNSPAQRVKTLAHELAHAILHEDVSELSVAEIEAESTAYVVCQFLGIDASDYSFGYVVTWAGDNQGSTRVRSAGQRIQTASASIIKALDNGANEIRPEPTQP